ncbi:MAG: hypothetical protein ACTSU2_04395 [Promethearchaeota archaeon]
MSKHEKEKSMLKKEEYKNKNITIINGKEYIKCAVKNCSNLVELEKGVKIDGEIFCPACASKMILFGINNLF